MTVFVLLFLASFLVSCVAAVSLIYPLRFLKIRTRGRALQLFIAGFALMVVAAVNLPNKAETARPAPVVVQEPAAAPMKTEASPVKTAAAKAAAVEPAMPPAQRRFIEIIEDARNRFDEAKNDLAKGATRPARAKAICSAMQSKQVADWIGTVHRLSSNSDGKGVLRVEIAEDIRLGTVDNAFSDIGYPTLIDGTSSLMLVAASLTKGQKIKFSGRFFADEPDCFAEMSVTQRGSMQSPHFIFRFTSISPL